MNVVIHQSGVSLEPILREYVERKIAKVGKMAERLGGDAAVLRVEIGRLTRHHKKGKVFRAEINCDIPGIPVKMLRAESLHWDIRAAIDETARNLIRQLKELRGRFAARTSAGARELKRRIREEG
jgi:ribosomal subunit interface protein